MSNEGKKVSVHYVGTLDDGTKFDSSRDRGETLDFVCMAGQMIKGFDNAVKDMEVGQTINVHIPAAEAYGEVDEGLIQKFPRFVIPNADQLPIGERIMLSNNQGMQFAAKVVEITDENVVFDMNHELAGQDLNFEIELVSVD